MPFFPSSFSTLGASGSSSYGFSVEKGLKKLFEQARKAAPCIVFLDEMDSVPARGTVGDHNSSYFHAVANAFLEVLDAPSARFSWIQEAAHASADQECGLDTVADPLSSSAPRSVESTVTRNGRLAQSMDDAHGFELLHEPYSAEQLSKVLRRVTAGGAGHRANASEAAPASFPLLTTKVHRRQSLRASSVSGLEGAEESISKTRTGVHRGPHHRISGSLPSTEPLCSILTSRSSP